MNPRTFVALASLTLVAGAAMADPTYVYYRHSIGPSGVDVLALGQAGGAACDDGLGGQLAPALDCDTSGISAIIEVDGLEDAHAHGHHFAVGTCAGSFPKPNAVVDSSFTFTCGSDRDDDLLVTNADLGASDPDGHDDDFATAHVASPANGGSVAICFRRDVAAAGHDWDTWSVFVLTNVPGLTANPGTYDIDVTATASDGCLPGQDVSGHCHGGYHGGHATPSPPPGPGPKATGLLLLDALNCP